MNPIIEKILKRISEITSSKFLFLLKTNENSSEIISSFLKIEIENNFIDDIIDWFKKLENLEVNNLLEKNEFKSIENNYKIKSAKTILLSKADNIKYYLIIFSEFEIEDNNLKNAELFFPFVVDLLEEDNNNFSFEFDLPILVTNSKGNKIFSNELFNSTFALNNDFDTKEELIFYDIDDRKLKFENYPFNEAVKQNKNIVEQKIKFRRDNEFKYFKVNSVISKNGKNNIEKVKSFFWDISELSEVEEIVKETTKNIESILYSTGPDAQKFYFITDAVKDLFGFTPQEIYKNRLLFLRKIFPEYIPNVRSFVKSLQEGKKSFVEYKFLDKDGNEKMVRHTGIPIIKEGDVVRVVGVIYDITQEKKILEDLEKSEEKFRVLIETANDLIFSLDKYGYFQTVNKTGALALGFSSSDMIGKHFLEFVDEDNKSDIAVAFQNLLNTEEVTQFETTLIDKFGSKLIFDIQASPTKEDETISGMIGIGREITERRKDEIKLKDLNSKLIEANRINQIERDRAKHQISVLEEINKLKNEFISNVSHELRTPLASIVGFAETMASGEDLPQEVITEFNGIILTEGKRLAKFINEVLDFSKLESDKNSLEISTFDIIPVLNELYINNKDLAAEKEITFSKEIPEAEIILEGDKGRIGNSINKLLSNAFKFTNKGGRITIIVQDFLREVEIIISDTGIGIPEEGLPNLFQKFRKVSSQGTQLPGAGFGLVTVKQVVDLHKGLIQVKSEVDKGTTFIIRLPKNN